MEPEEINGLKNGLIFEDFEILKSISSGTFGDVFLSKNKQTCDKLYAIKTVRLRAQDSEDDIKGEIEILERIHNFSLKPRSIPKFYGFYKEINKFKQIQYYLIFEFLPQNLKTLIQNLKLSQDILPFEKVKFFFETLIDGLAFLQTIHVCHRDLKPENLLLDENLENIFLIDYGVSKTFITSAPNETKKHLEIEGSPLYFSPELFQAYEDENSKSVVMNPYKSDVFSFGLVFLEFLNGKLPKKNENFEVWRKNIDAAIISFKKTYEITLKIEEKEDFEFFIKTLLKCLEMDPGKRPDFLTLFKKNFKKISELESLKMHILIQDLKIKNETFIPKSLSFLMININKFIFFIAHKNVPCEFELRGCSYDKNIGVKVWGKCTEKPETPVFYNRTELREILENMKPLKNFYLETNTYNNPSKQKIATYIFNESTLGNLLDFDVSHLSILCTPDEKLCDNPTKQFFHKCVRNSNSFYQIQKIIDPYYQFFNNEENVISIKHFMMENSINGVTNEQFNEMISYSTNFLNLNKLQYLDLQLTSYGNATEKSLENLPEFFKAMHTKYLKGLQLNFMIKKINLQNLEQILKSMKYVILNNEETGMQSITLNLISDTILDDCFENIIDILPQKNCLKSLKLHLNDVSNQINFENEKFIKNMEIVLPNLMIFHLGLMSESSNSLTNGKIEELFTILNKSLNKNLKNISLWIFSGKIIQELFLTNLWSLLECRHNFSSINIYSAGKTEEQNKLEESSNKFKDSIKAICKNKSDMILIEKI